MVTIQIIGPIVSDSVIKEYQKNNITATSPSTVKLPMTAQPIKVVINSTGGDVFAGSEIYSMLKMYQGHITVEIVGIAGSIASVIAMAGDKVRISPTAQIMIHEASTATRGNKAQHLHTINTLDKINNSIINAYQLKTKKSRVELSNMMKKETWMTAKQAKAHKFVDEIMFENQSRQKPRKNKQGFSRFVF
ncbi:TPA: Clp protease ClpP [Streptococcus suis]|nr:Clp protease ClpP [Streptococcus suis]